MGTTSSVAALCAAPPSPEEEGKESADAGAVIDRARMEAEAVADRWIEGERLKRAVGNHHTSEDYEMMIRNVPTTYRLRPLSVLWAVVGLIVWASVEFIRWEERRWRA